MDMYGDISFEYNMPSCSMLWRELQQLNEKVKQLEFRKERAINKKLSHNIIDRKLAQFQEARKSTKLMLQTVYYIQNKGILQPGDVTHHTDILR